MSVLNASPWRLCLCTRYEHVNYLKSPEGGRAKMGEFERYFTEKGEAQGELKERIKNVKAIMKNAKVSAQEAMKILEVPSEEQQELLPLL